MSQTSAMFAKVARPFVAMSVRGKHVSIVLAVAVHALLLIFLFYGIRWQTQVPDAVEVELVRSEPAASVPAPSPEPRPQPAPQPAPQPKVEPRPAAPIAKPDIALKDKEKLKPKPNPPARVENKPDPFRKLLEQELKQTTAELKTAEQSKAISQELSQLKAAMSAAARARADADYAGRIISRIRSRIPDSALPPGNPVAKFEVVQLPSGEVLEVKRTQPSGYPAYDEAIERAINASSPLPKPPLGGDYRVLKLSVCPDESRGCK